jgi:AcrR family transcriptional regulator
MTEVLAKPVTARRAQTQERLMAAAGRVFAERGITGASVEEICEAAGFTRGAFYSNFADKDELVLAMVRQSIGTQVAAAEQAVARTKAATAELDAADLVAHTLATFAESGLGGRDSVLTERELLLYAARQPALREPYLAFAAECDRQLSVLILDALAYAGLEFSVPVAEGVALLVATWQHQQTELLFEAQTQPALMHTLVTAITRPRP